MSWSHLGREGSEIETLDFFLINLKLSTPVLVLKFFLRKLRAKLAIRGLMLLDTTSMTRYSANVNNVSMRGRGGQ